MKFPIYYNRDGSPMEGGTLEWAKKLETEDRRVGFKKMWFGLIDVSTVWLGLDHDFSWGVMRGDLDEPNPRPIIYETMVFIRGRGCQMWRYSTMDEAEAGHKRVVLRMLNPIRVIRMWWEYR